MATFASPIAHAGVAYWVCNSGRVTGFDAKTGEQLFNEELAEPCWATPLAVDDRIYFFGRDGTTTVIAQGRTFKTLAVNTLWKQHKRNEPATAASSELTDEDDPLFESPAQYSVAAVDGRILIRSGTAVYCVRSGK
jgi:outer membrane protein assembly factor BamB